MVDTSKDDDEEVQRKREEREAAKRKEEKVGARLPVLWEICPCCISTSYTRPVDTVHCSNQHRQSADGMLKSTLSGLGRCLQACIISQRMSRNNMLWKLLP